MESRVGLDPHGSLPAQESDSVVLISDQLLQTSEEVPCRLLQYIHS